MSKEQVLDEIRIHREEEFFARRFFKPFEISLDHLLVAFQNKERRIDEMNVHADFVSIFSGQWPVLKLLPLHLAVMLVHLLPYLEQITASLAKTGECMSILTGVPVRLKRGDKCVTEAPPRSCPPVRPVPFGRHDGGGEPFCRRHIPAAAGNRPPVRPENGDLFPGSRQQPDIERPHGAVPAIGQGDTSPLYHPTGGRPFPAGYTGRTVRVPGNQYLFIKKQNIIRHETEK